MRKKQTRKMSVGAGEISCCKETYLIYLKENSMKKKYPNIHVCMYVCIFFKGQRKRKKCLKHSGSKEAEGRQELKI